MIKNHIRIIVQGNIETGEEFAQTLEAICAELSVREQAIPQIAFMTSASDGRQTATIQFQTINNAIHGSIQLHVGSSQLNVLNK